MKAKFFRNPIKWYVQEVKTCIEPTSLKHRIRMNIDIKKGETKGRALIPCAIYSFDHSIDLNPALIRRKDGKKVKDLPVNKNISYDSKKYDVQLTKEEKKLGYKLEQLESCKHCGQRLVIAEIAETRYRSCPDIKVRVADKAKEDLRIPVDFGINKSDVYFGMTFWIIVDAVIVYTIINSVTGWNIGIPINNAFNAIPSTIMMILLTPIFIWLMFWVTIHIARIHYKAYKLFTWWKQVKHTVTNIRVAN